MTEMLFNPIIFVLIIAWTLPWKAIALWRAAKRGHKIWFVVLLVTNTLAILDILYLLIFSKRIGLPAVRKDVK